MEGTNLLNIVHFKIHYNNFSVFSVRNRIENTATIVTSVAVQDRALSQTPNQTHALFRLGVGQGHAHCLRHLPGHGPNQSRNLDPDLGLRLAVPALPQNVRFECPRLDPHPDV